MNSQIKSIEVLGSGCPNCKKLFELTQVVVRELNLNIEVQYITDIQKILELGVMSSPVLSINGQAVLSGEMPNSNKLKAIISSYQLDREL